MSERELVFYHPNMSPRFQLRADCNLLKLNIIEDDFDIYDEITGVKEGWNKALFKNIKRNLKLILPIITEVFKKHFPELTFDSEQDIRTEIKDYGDHCSLWWFTDERPFSDLTEDEKIHKAAEMMSDIAKAIVMLLEGGDK